ncbi:MAG: isopentenyl-diphosphate delta-isomerase [Candidatus Poseidoniales archaeon]|nr:MAG: isopentenyl-diphosphate delta-isomerase [Candidatus Poseidoniales archaeon]
MQHRMTMASAMRTDVADEDAELLDGLDAQQVDMMAEALILVDEQDRPLGRASKVKAHRHAGAYHRAFSVMLFDEHDRLLLQRRADDKITFPGIWANTCCSHPLDVPEERDETNGIGVRRAAVRKLEQELGIEAVGVDDLTYVGRFRYQARQDETWIEREVDHLLVGRVNNLTVNPNPNEVAEVRWVSHDELEAMLIEEDPEHPVAPWFRCIAARLMTEAWWTATAAEDFQALRDDHIHDLGDVSHMLPNAVGADLSTSVLEVLPLIESRIAKRLTASRHPRLGQAMMHLIEGGGKRMRASLPWLVAKAIGDTHSGLLDVGAAIEIIHNFTLVHDDIMDDDPVRRGRPAVHIAYDVPTAINAGDAMLAIAFEHLCDAPSFDMALLPDIVERIAWMVRRVSEGQQLDIEFEHESDVTEPRYLEMIEGKTAVMFQVCSELGALLSGADEDTIDCMREWGLNVGLCFQLMDDLIDVVSDTATLGKPAGSDVAQGKRTLMVIHALDQPESEAKSDLLRVLGKGEEATTEDIEAAHAGLEASGSIAYGRERATAYHAAAHACLDRLPSSPALRALREFTDLQLARLS